jgi:hypothetical protein
MSGTSALHRGQIAYEGQSRFDLCGNLNCGLLKSPTITPIERFTSGVPADHELCGERLILN